MIDRTHISRVWLTDTAVYIETNDGWQAREVYADYRPLREATPEQRQRYVISHYGLHWPELDEDLSFDGFFEADKLVATPY